MYNEVNGVHVNVMISAPIDYKFLERPCVFTYDTPSCDLWNLWTTLLKIFMKLETIPELGKSFYNMGGSAKC